MTTSDSLESGDHELTLMVPPAKTWSTLRSSTSRAHIGEETSRPSCRCDFRCLSGRTKDDRFSVRRDMRKPVFIFVIGDPLRFGIIRSRSVCRHSPDIPASGPIRMKSTIHLPSGEYSGPSSYPPLPVSRCSPPPLTETGWISTPSAGYFQQKASHCPSGDHNRGNSWAKRASSASLRHCRQPSRDIPATAARMDWTRKTQTICHQREIMIVVATNRRRRPS